MNGADTDGGRARVHLVRHGATEWSELGRHTGRSDIPLSDKGRKQATRVGAALAGQSFSLVLTSPLRRAVETCTLAGYADVAQQDPALLEWDYGRFEGRTTAEIRVEHPGWTVWDGPIPGGETIDDVASRADLVIEQCRSAGGDVAVFAHGHVLRVLAARWCEMDPREGRRLPLETGRVSVLGWEHESPGLRLWNGTG